MRPIFMVVTRPAIIWNRFAQMKAVSPVSVRRRIWHTFASRGRVRCDFLTIFDTYLIELVGVAAISVPIDRAGARQSNFHGKSEQTKDLAGRNLVWPPDK